MSRTADIIISTVMWCSIAAYVALAGSYGRTRRQEITVRQVRIAIADSARGSIVSREMVSRWLSEEGLAPLGEAASTLDTRAIENSLETRPEVKRASAWTDLEGVLTVRVEGRTPLMRVRSVGGYRFWFTTCGYLVPDRGDFTAWVPVVTGDIPFPFPASTAGSYGEVRRENYNDFLGRFTALENERLSLRGQLSDVRSDIRSERSTGPKRFWSRARKKAFNDARALRLAELKEQQSRLESQLASLAARKSELAEKEKKSYQSHRFLTKLANFVEFVERDDFWGAQIVQINVPGSGAQGTQGAHRAHGLWREPRLELIPRAGDHTVLLGVLDGTEKERLEKLRLFYVKGLNHEGWDEYAYIDIEYKDQIVCTK